MPSASEPLATTADACAKSHADQALRTYPRRWKQLLKKGDYVALVADTTTRGVRAPSV